MSSIPHDYVPTRTRTQGARQRNGHLLRALLFLIAVIMMNMPFLASAITFH